MPRAGAQEREARFHRFQYHKFHWKAFHTSAFHIYFPVGYDSLCKVVAAELPGALKLVRKRTGAALQQVPNVIIYPSIDGLYESNIGSAQTDEVTFPTFILKGNRLVIAYNGSLRDLMQQLNEALARATWEGQLSAGLQMQVQGAGKETIPYWISEGMIRYFAHGWPLQAEDHLLRTLKETDYPEWEALVAKYPALSGQAFCYYLSRNYFERTPEQLFLQLRKRKPLARVLRLITQTPADSLYYGCLQFYKARGDAVSPGRDTSGVEIGGSVAAFAHRQGVITKVVSQSPDGRTAYVTAWGSQRSVYIYDPLAKRKTFLTSWSMPPWIPDHSADLYPVISWTEQGGDLLVTAPVKGKLTIRRYSADGHKQDTYPLPGIDGIGSMGMYSSEDYLLTAWRRAQSDIVSYNLPKDKYTPFTNDRWDDRQPSLSAAGNELLFSSERQIPRSRKDQRLADTVLAVQGIFSAGKEGINPWLVDTPGYILYEHPVRVSGGRVLITTTIKGTMQSALVSNLKAPAVSVYSRPLANAFQYLPRTDEVVTWASTRDSLFLHHQPLQQWIAGNRDTAKQISPWLEDYNAAAAARAKEDSILKAANANVQPSFLSGVLSGSNAGKRAVKQSDSIRKALAYDDKKTVPYILQLYSAYFSAKVNNDYFINRYQPYQSYQGMFKFPEIGGMAQGGFSDLFENHHVSIAFRLPAGSEGSDFFIRYNNTAGNVDWGIAYYRKSEDLKPDPDRRWVDESGQPYPNTAKVKSNYFEVNAQYPLSYYSGLDFTTAIRHDKTIFLATEKYSLDFPAYKSLWSITTLSYSINKLKPTLPLLYRGFAGNMRIDGFKGFTQKEEALSGSSVNLSYHQPLYKYITIVGQLHAGASGGDSRVLYNLGGVDNNITPRVDSNVHFAQDAPYAFQTLITPFRGYYQNSLYGSNYCLLNVDVYFPLFQSLLPIETPLSSVNNLQLGLFTDIAAAGGKGPYTTAGKGWLTSYGISARTILAGYPLRVDIGWPETFKEKPVWYLSLNLK